MRTWSATTHNIHVSMHECKSVHTSMCCHIHIPHIPMYTHMYTSGHTYTYTLSYIHTNTYIYSIQHTLELVYLATYSLSQGELLTPQHLYPSSASAEQPPSSPVNTWGRRNVGFHMMTSMTSSYNNGGRNSGRLRETSKSCGPPVTEYIQSKWYSQ